MLRHHTRFHNGLILILGGYYMGLAYSWAQSPPAARVAGIDWLSIPDWAVHPYTVAAIWAFGGVTCLAGYFMRSFRGVALLVSLVAFLVPFTLGAFFAGAWVLTGMGEADAPTGLVTAWSYWLPAVIAAWGMLSAPRHVAVVTAEPGQEGT